MESFAGLDRFESALRFGSHIIILEEMDGQISREEARASMYGFSKIRRNKWSVSKNQRGAFLAEDSPRVRLADRDRLLPAGG
jgi:hypothetical protein